MLGHEHANTLMTHLPQDRSDEVATKGDIARLESQIVELRRDLHSMQRFYVGTVVGSMMALTAIFSFVVALIR